AASGGAGTGAAELRVAFVNPAFTYLTGYSAEELVGRRPRLFDHSEADRAVIDSARAVLAAGRSVIVEALGRCKDGSERWIEVRAAPIRDRAGRVTHYVAAHRDVTARRQSQEAAERSSQAKSHFLSRLSHELMTPLNALIGFPELLAGGHLGPLND